MDNFKEDFIDIYSDSMLFNFFKDFKEGYKDGNIDDLLVDDSDEDVEYYGYAKLIGSEYGVQQYSVFFEETYVGHGAPASRTFENVHLVTEDSMKGFLDRHDFSDIICYHFNFIVYGFYDNHSKQFYLFSSDIASKYFSIEFGNLHDVLNKLKIIMSLLFCIGGRNLKFLPHITVENRSLSFPLKYKYSYSPSPGTLSKEEIKSCIKSLDIFKYVDGTKQSKFIDKLWIPFSACSY